jgi:8-oxo-dGTP pyrophosphatase MutT (NUDIX family)
MEKHELVDINGNKTGKVLTNSEIHNFDNIPNGYYVPVVGVVIINGQNEILLEKRSKFKKINPSKWGVCGGKINLDETPIDAGIRETFEEIGINLKKEDLKLFSINTSENAHFTVYYTRKDVDLSECKLQEEELDEIKYFKIDDLHKLDNEGFEWLDHLKNVIDK